MPTAKEKTKTKTYKAPVSEYFTTSCDTELTWGGGRGGTNTNRNHRNSYERNINQTRSEVQKVRKARI